MLKITLYSKQEESLNHGTLYTKGLYAWCIVGTQQIFGNESRANTIDQERLIGIDLVGPSIFRERRETIRCKKCDIINDYF